MKKIFLKLYAQAAIVTFCLFLFSACQSNSPQTSQPLASTTMKLSSPAFQQEQSIPARYTCDGENINPPLTIEEVPKNTVSLALVVDDPDAPAGDWTHWLVWNIKPATTSIAENSVPDFGAMEGTTDFKSIGWGGPCPPSGTHRYFFKLYALDTLLKLPSTTTKADLEKAMGAHILATTELVGLYKKS